MNLKIGILACDHVNPDQKDNHGDYDDMFIDLIHSQDNSIEFCIYDLINDHFPVDIDACDAYIISGSQFGVYENLPWINKAKQLVKRLNEYNIPTIGICFGHQLIAESLGGKVVKAEDKGLGIGVLTWDITSKPDWSNQVYSSPQISLNACHEDQVIQLPTDSKVYLSSAFCPIAAFEVDSMLGIQGHPEFDSKYTQYLFDILQHTLSESSKDLSKASLNTSVNSNIISSWMVDFIKHKLSLA